jgi:hypothetical protein
MRALLCGVAMLLSVGSAKADQLWNGKIAQWHVAAYASKGIRNFSHCAASAVNQNGVILHLTINRNFGSTIAFSSPHLQLSIGKTYSLSYWVDDNPPIKAIAVANMRDLAVISLKNSSSLFQLFRGGKTLYLKSRTRTSAYDLADVSTALAYLLRCAEGGGIRPSSAVAAGAHSDNTAASQPDARKQESEALRNEAIILAANLLSELRITGFKFLAPNEVPAGFSADAVWKTPSGIGTVTVLPGASDGAAVPGVIISADAKACRKQFASGSLPSESGVTKLFTKCGIGSDALVAFYFVVPRKTSGQYVIGTYSLGEAAGGTAIDEGMRAAVFRALLN